MPNKAFVYTEFQISVPFERSGWRERNEQLLRVPGLTNKTWLAGVKTDSLGGLYEFESLESAKRFAVEDVPARTASLGVAQTARIFDGSVVEAASRELNSLHFGGRLLEEPGAFVYTEVQIALPFEDVPWGAMNPALLQQPGLLHKTWLSGYRSQSVGGFYAFDTLDNATRFVTGYFPTEAKKLDAAYTTRIFDAAVVRDANRQMRSPFVSAEPALLS